MTTSEFIMDQLSFTDMTGMVTYLGLVVFFVIGALSLAGDEHMPAPLPVACAVMVVITPLAWLGISGVQYISLETDFRHIQELEHILEKNEELVPHPYLIKLETHKEGLVESMKAHGDFGEYSEVFVNADRLTNRDYTQSEHAPFFVSNAAKVCFKTGVVPDSIIEVLSVYPFSINELATAWEKESYRIGVANPACTTSSVIGGIR